MTVLSDAASRYHVSNTAQNLSPTLQTVARTQDSVVQCLLVRWGICIQAFTWTSERLHVPFSLQSRVFPAVFESDRNTLVCAPTGAGKTVIAVLAMLQCVKAHMSRGIIRKDAFKIVFIAPLKALAAEMERSLSRRLQPLGLTVRQLTGEAQLSRAEIEGTQVRGFVTSKRGRR